MTLVHFLVLIVIVIGTSVATCVVMETYYQRRAEEEVGEFDAAEELTEDDATTER